MRVTSRFVAVAALLWGLGAAATTPGADPLTLKVAHPIDYTPGFLPAQVVCDDLTVIRVDDAGTTFRLTGLKPGTTLCSFTSVAVRGRRRVLEITVAP